jgi:hypothetical protein
MDPTSSFLNILRKSTLKFSSCEFMYSTPERVRSPRAFLYCTVRSSAFATVRPSADACFERSCTVVRSSLAACL